MLVAEAQGTTELRLTVADGKKETFGITPHAHAQLADYVGIPLGDYRRIQVEAPELLARTVNRSMKAKGKDARMLRTLDGAVRAFLGARYRVLETEDVADAVLPVLRERKLIIVSCAITDQCLYIKAVDRSIERDIPTGKRLGDGSHAFFDTISPGIVVSYSEVGAGSVDVDIETSIWTKVCTNLAVTGTPLRHHHLSGRQELSGFDYLLATRENRELTVAALRGPVRDLVISALDEARFEAAAKMLMRAARSPLGSGNVVEVVERVGERFGLDELEKSSVLHHLLLRGDLTLYGLHAAITRASADVVDYDRATAMERLGGRIIDPSALEWTVISQALPRVSPATLRFKVA